jgi:hypothetical protein
MLGAHGGELNGFFIIRGDSDELDQLRRSDEFMKLVLQAGSCLNGFGVMAACQGDALTDLVGKWPQMVGTNG